MNRRKVEKVVQSLDFDWHTFSFDGFVQHVQIQRKREITILEIKKMIFPGYCISMDKHKFDYIFVNADDHAVSRLHNKIHELGHFLLNHLDSVIIINGPNELSQLMMRFSRLRSHQNMSPQLLAEEREAEYFAYLVSDNVSKAQRLSALTLEEESYAWGVPPFYGRFADNFNEDNS